MKLEERILRSVKQRRGNIVLRSDFADMGSSTRITEVLRSLQQRGILIRVGTGVYSKTRVSTVTGRRIAAGSLETLASEILDKFGIKVEPSRAAKAYNAGLTTQIPGSLVVNTGDKRISRKIFVGGRNLKYENNIQSSVATA
jgi:predicted transcriptional regulator of viral defense system